MRQKKRIRRPAQRIARSLAEAAHPRANGNSRPGALPKAALRRGKARRGRPQIGKGAAVICVSIERGLLEQTDRLAARLGVPRTALIARGLRALLEREIAVRF